MACTFSATHKASIGIYILCTSYGGIFFVSVPSMDPHEMYLAILILSWDWRPV